MAMNKQKWNCIVDLALLVMITNVGGVCRSVLHEKGALVDICFCLSPTERDFQQVESCFMLASGASFFRPAVLSHLSKNCKSELLAKGRRVVY